MTKYTMKHQIIYDQDLLEEIFEDISPFNMNKDFRRLKKLDLDLYLLQELEALIHMKKFDVVLKNSKTSKEGCFIRLVKIRIKNPLNHKGKSSGFRVICIVDDYNSITYLLHVYQKDGANKKSNITKEERKSAIAIFQEVKNEFGS